MLFNRVKRSSFIRQPRRVRNKLEVCSILQASNSGKSSDVKSSSIAGHTKFKEDKREEKHRSRPKPKLTEDEKERRRQEMMANAMWRDKEREKNVKMYREEEKREAQSNKSYNRDFIR